MSLFFPTSVLQGIVAPYTLCQVTASYTSWARALPFTNWPGCFPSSLSLPPLLQPDGEPCWGPTPPGHAPAPCPSQLVLEAARISSTTPSLSSVAAHTHCISLTQLFFPSDSSRLCLTHHDSLVFPSLIFPPLLPRPLIIQP